MCRAEGLPDPGLHKPSQGKMCGLDVAPAMRRQRSPVPFTVPGAGRSKGTHTNPLLRVRPPLGCLAPTSWWNPHSHPSGGLFSPHFPDGAPEAWRDGAVAQADPGRRVEGAEDTGKGIVAASERLSLPQRLPSDERPVCICTELWCEGQLCLVSESPPCAGLRAWAQASRQRAVGVSPWERREMHLLESL